MLFTIVIVTNQLKIIQLNSLLQLYLKNKLMEKSLSIANQIVDQKDFETYLISKFEM